LVNKLVLKDRNHSWVKHSCKDHKHLFISNVRKTFIVFPAKSLIKHLTIICNQGAHLDYPKSPLESPAKQINS